MRNKFLTVALAGLFLIQSIPVSFADPQDPAYLATLQTAPTVSATASPTPVPSPVVIADPYNTAMMVSTLSAPTPSPLPATSLPPEMVSEASLERDENAVLAVSTDVQPQAPGPAFAGGVEYFPGTPTADSFHFEMTVHGGGAINLYWELRQVRTGAVVDTGGGYVMPYPERSYADILNLRSNTEYALECRFSVGLITWRETYHFTTASSYPNPDPTPSPEPDPKPTPESSPDPEPAPVPNPSPSINPNPSPSPITISLGIDWWDVTPETTTSWTLRAQISNYEMLGGQEVKIQYRNLTTGGAFEPPQPILKTPNSNGYFETTLSPLLADSEYEFKIWSDFLGTLLISTFETGGGGVPAPNPSPMPDPRETPKPDPTPDPRETPKPKPTPFPSPSIDPKPTPDPIPRPTPFPSPVPVPKPTPFPSPIPVPKPTPFPGPILIEPPTPAPWPSSDPRYIGPPVPAPKPSYEPKPMPPAPMPVIYYKALDYYTPLNFSRPEYKPYVSGVLPQPKLETKPAITPIVTPGEMYAAGTPETFIKENPDAPVVAISFPASHSTLIIDKVDITPAHNYAHFAFHLAKPFSGIIDVVLWNSTRTAIVMQQTIDVEDRSYFSFNLTGLVPETEYWFELDLKVRGGETGKMRVHLTTTKAPAPAPTPVPLPQPGPVPFTLSLTNTNVTSSSATFNLTIKDAPATPAFTVLINGNVWSNSRIEKMDAENYKVIVNGLNPSTNYQITVEAKIMSFEYATSKSISAMFTTSALNVPVPGTGGGSVPHDDLTKLRVQMNPAQITASMAIIGGSLRDENGIGVSGKSVTIRYGNPNLGISYLSQTMVSSTDGAFKFQLEKLLANTDYLYTISVDGKVLWESGFTAKTEVVNSNEIVKTSIRFEGNEAVISGNLLNKDFFGYPVTLSYQDMDMGSLKTILVGTNEDDGSFTARITVTPNHRYQYKLTFQGQSTNWMDFILDTATKPVTTGAMLAPGACDGLSGIELEECLDSDARMI